MEVQPEQPEPPDVAFAEKLHRLTPRLIVTPTIIAVNVLVFAMMVAADSQPTSNPGADELISWGANYGPKTTNGEWWRLVTGNYLHISIIHIALNMLVLGFLGWFVERLIGNIGFLAMYTMSGMLGSVATIVWNPYLVGAGASGAVMGVCGCLFGFINVRRRDIPRDALINVQIVAVGFIGFSLIYGASFGGIDMAAHLSGLGVGFLCGLTLSLPLEITSLSRRLTRAALVASTGLAAASIGAYALHGKQVDLQVELTQLTETESQVISTFNTALSSYLNDDSYGGNELIEVLDRDVIAPWIAQLDALEALRGLPEQRAKPVNSIMAYMRKRLSAWRLLKQGVLSGNVQTITEALDMYDEAGQTLENQLK